MSLGTVGVRLDCGGSSLRYLVSGITSATSNRANTAINASPRKATAYPAPTTTAPAAAWLSEPPIPGPC